MGRTKNVRLSFFANLVNSIIVSRPPSGKLVVSVDRVKHYLGYSLLSVAYLDNLEFAVLWVSLELNNIAYFHFNSVVVGDVSNIACWVSVR